MMMKKPIPVIYEEVHELEKQLKQEKDGRRKIRLHMLYLFKSGKCRTRCEVAEALAVHRNTIRRWLNRYQQGGLDALLIIEEPGAKPGQKTLPQQVIDSLGNQLKEEGGFASYGEIQSWLLDTHGIAVKYKTVPYCPL